MEWHSACLHACRRCSAKQPCPRAGDQPAVEPGSRSGGPTTSLGTLIFLTQWAAGLGSRIEAAVDQPAECPFRRVVEWHGLQPRQQYFPSCELAHCRYRQSAIATSSSSTLDRRPNIVWAFLRCSSCCTAVNTMHALTICPQYPVLYALIFPCTEHQRGTLRAALMRAAQMEGRRLLQHVNMMQSLHCKHQKAHVWGKEWTRAPRAQDHSVP